MLEDEVDHVPVLSAGQLVGICTRADVLRARHHLLAAEQRQPGWLTRLRIGQADGVTPSYRDTI